MRGSQLVRWNQWYDRSPPDWRFQFILWPLIALGGINLLLTVSTGFPFALLVILGIFLIITIRVPYQRGWVAPSEPAAEPSPRQHIGWFDDLNRRYDDMPEFRRFWVLPMVLVIAGALNMAMTIAGGFPFGLLFLFALLAVAAIRIPYAGGWFQAPAAGPTKPTPVISNPDHPQPAAPKIAEDTAAETSVDTPQPSSSKVDYTQPAHSSDHPATPTPSQDNHPQSPTGSDNQTENPDLPKI